MKNKIIVGLSGGVDSSVCALLLKQQGYNIEGVFMKNWEEDDTDEWCSAEVDLSDAQSVASSLDINLKTINFSSEYWERVFQEFLDEYRAGRTPNPDVMCNQEVKFKAFLEYALSLGATAIATGHYARLDKSGNTVRLLKGKDHNKDQSYFLHRLTRSQLQVSLFPLGDLEKSEVRTLAEKHLLITSDKKDSTGICFIGERPFKDFLSGYIACEPGVIKTTDGQIVGQHQGAVYYTFGQRKGLGIGGMKGASEEPWYVVDKDIQNNIVYVGQGHNHPLLFRNSLSAIRLSWISGTAPETPYRCHAKVRYRQQDQACTITSISENSCTVIFDEPQRAVTPGQSVVFYQGDECLGGGIINSTENVNND